MHHSSVVTEWQCPSRFKLRRATLDLAPILLDTNSQHFDNSSRGWLRLKAQYAQAGGIPDHGTPAAAINVDEADACSKER